MHFQVISEWWFDVTLGTLLSYAARSGPDTTDREVCWLSASRRAARKVCVE